jgi:hypothetical protein
MFFDSRLRIPILLYIPNLIGYLRIICAFIGLYFANIHQPQIAVVIWIFSSTLDLFDGIIARMLHQTSKFGIILDIIADNVLRTTVWLAVSNTAFYHNIIQKEVSSTSSQFNLNQIIMILSCCIICIEWITMVATQVHSTSTNGLHWKEARQHDPWIVQQFFSNNFRNPIGCLGIYGLFAANLFIFGSYHPILYNHIPYYNFFMYLALLGRFLSLSIEMRFCYSYISFVLNEDTKREDDKTTEKEKTK